MLTPGEPYSKVDPSSRSRDSAEIIGWTTAMRLHDDCLTRLTFGNRIALEGALMPIALTPPVAIHQSVSTPRPDDRHRQLVHRVRSEYREMPGVCPTFDQACRLWAHPRPCGCLLTTRSQSVMPRTITGFSRCAILAWPLAGAATH